MYIDPVGALGRLFERSCGSLFSYRERAFFGTRQKTFLTRPGMGVRLAGGRDSRT